MRKLLLFFAMLSVSIGAWATSFQIGTSGNTYCTDKGDGNFILHIGNAADISGSTSFTNNVGMYAQKFSEGAKVAIEVADGVDLSAKGHDDWYWIFQYEKGVTVDLSGLNQTNADLFKDKWDYVWNSTQVKSVIVPTVYADDIDTFAQGVLSANVSGINFYGVSSDKSFASAYITSDSQSDLSNIVAGVDGTVTSVNVSGTAVGENVINAINSLNSLTDATITGKMHAGLNNIVVNNDNITSLDFSGIKPADGNTLTINVSGCANLTNINLTDVTVSTVTVSNGYTGTINVTDPNNLGFTLLPEGIEQTANIKGPVLPPYTFASTTMYLHESEANDKFVYWYSGTEQTNKVVTIGMSEDRNLSEIADELTDSYQKVIITGPLTSADLDALKKLNCQVLDLSQAVVTDEVLANKFSTENALNENTRFLVAPMTSTRETLVNARSLAGLRNIYSVVAYSENTTATVGNGYNLTSYTRVPGTLQAAVTSAMASAANSWTRNEKSVYTSSVSTFRDVIVSGALNAYDMGGAPSGGLKLDDNGHLAWDTEAVEGSVSDNRTQTGTNTVYGPFSSSFKMTSIDMKEATFESIGDMTISYLGITSSATGKIVISQDPSVKEIPAFFMSSVTDIKAICIPSNIEIIRTRAFYSLDYIWTTSGVNDPEGANTKLDNGATYSQSGDVVYGSTDETLNYRQACVAGTYTFSSNLKMIETGAFSNATPHVKDVYVLNTVAPECHVDAFNTAMYSGNGGYSPVITDGIITRDSYIKENNQWITMLHYPRETTTPNVQRYTDPTRNYSIATGLRDGKGGIVYFPSQSEFIRAYLQGTYGYTWQAWDPTRVNGGVDNGDMNNTTNPWNATEQASANTLYTNNTTTAESTKPYTSFYDVTLGGDNQPSGLVEYYKVNWNETSYSAVETGGNLYPERNTLNSAINETTERDYRGWHQFVLTAYAANTTLEEEPYRSYITDNEWWTICPEFDITYAESAILFGTANRITTSGPTTYPYISKLQYVRRDYGRETIYLSFSKNLNENRETFYEGSKHGVADETTGVIVLNSNHEFNADDVVMKAGVPYLIKPCFSPGAVRQFRIFENDADLSKYKLANPESNVVAFSNSALYNKIHASQSVKGSDQMDEVKAGTYSVPVFVSEKDGEGLEKEAVEMSGSTPKEFKIADITYHRSTKYRYTFVGTFYKSFLPHYSYFLGWDSNNNCAKFFYHNGNFETIDNEMRWANGTGVIVPSTIADDFEDGKFKYSVTPAGSDSQGNAPAQWTLLNTFNDDSFVTKTGSAKQYVMEFESPDVIAEDSGVTAIETIEPVQTKQQPEVYDLQGRKVTTMSKGIYIVGGKKYVVK